MEAIWVWVTIVGLTAATFITRSGFLLLGDRVNLPARVERALRYAPACALVAIVLPELVYSKGQLQLGFENFRLLAALAAGAFFYFKRDLLLTIIFGMVVFTGLRLGFGV